MPEDIQMPWGITRILNIPGNVRTASQENDLTPAAQA